MFMHKKAITFGIQRLENSNNGENQLDKQPRCLYHLKLHLEDLLNTMKRAMQQVMQI